MNLRCYIIPSHSKVVARRIFFGVIFKLSECSHGKMGDLKFLVMVDASHRWQN